MYIKKSEYEYLLRCKRRAESIWKAQRKYEAKKRMLKCQGK